MTDPIAEIDQLEAWTRDLLAKLGLEKCGVMMPDPAWLDRISGRDLWEFLLVGAVASTSAGHLWCLIAQSTPDGESTAAFMLEARKSA